MSEAIATLERPQNRALTRANSATVTALESIYADFLGAMNNPSLTLASRSILAAMARTEMMEAFQQPEIMRVIRGLAGSPLGFRTDRDYPDKVLAEACVEATLKGLPLFGNRFNVIADRFYCTKEGFELLVGQTAQYALKCIVSPISSGLRASGGHVDVQAIGQYRRRDAGEDGKNERLTVTYSVRLTKNNKVAEENVEGKAKRKWLRDVWARLSGLELEDAEIENGMEPAAPPLSQGDFSEHPTVAPVQQAAGAAVLMEEALKRAGKLDDAVEAHGPPDTWGNKDLEDLALLLPKAEAEAS